MKKLRILFALAIFASAFFTACTGSDSDNALGNDTTAILQPDFDPVFYKHLKGNLGTQSVIFDITCDGKLITGSYYYLGSGELINLSGKLEGNGKIELMESINQKNTGTISGLITNDSLTGFWFSKDKKTQQKINLKEDYQSALKLKPYFLHDTIKLTEATGGPAGTYSKLVLMPMDSSELTSLFKGAQFSAKNISFHAMELLNQERDEFRKDYLELKQDYSPELGISSFSWDYSNVNTVLYNDNGYMSLRSSNYEFTGGAHGNYSSLCAVYSVDSIKQLKLTDIFAKGFEKKLNQAINNRLRKLYDVQANETLADAGFLIEYLTYTNNFYLTSSGVGFLYPPSDVAPDALGEIEIFIPFDEVKSIMNKNFKLKTII